ncbi:hypothetical protein BC940DRAFT_330739 [Gongronella butleri]|nr:hypothetical protein BC940DRAFT_330739 [Gongronella butleri]
MIQATQFMALSGATGRRLALEKRKEELLDDNWIMLAIEASTPSATTADVDVLQTHARHKFQFEATFNEFYGIPASRARQRAICGRQRAEARTANVLMNGGANTPRFK